MRLFYLVLLTSFQFCFAQEYSFRHYSVSDGLPQTQVWDIFQDSKGYIWICTKGGLAKFDGLEFITYTTKDGLNDDFVYHISEGPDSALYITSQKGVNRYKNREITTIYQSPDYITTHSRIEMFNQDSGMYLKNGYVYSLVNGKLGKPINDKFTISNICINEKNNLFCTSSNGIYTYNGNHLKVIAEGRNIFLQNRKDKLFLLISASDTIYEIINSQLIPIFEIKGNEGRPLTPNDYEEQIIVFSTADIFKLKGNSITRIELPNWTSHIIFSDNKNKLWFGTQKGLEYRINTTFRNFENPYFELDNIYNIWEDKIGNIWLGSFYNKIWKYDGYSIEDMTTQKNGIDTRIYSGQIKDFDGKTLISTNTGFLKFSKDGLNQVYKELQEYTMFAIKDNYRNRLLAALHPSGLYYLDSGKTFKKLDFNVTDQTGIITSVLVDKFGEYWVSGKLGVCKYSYENGWINLKDSEFEFNNGAISMTMDNQGNIWLGSMDGVYYHNYQSFKKVGNQFFDSQIGSLSITDDNELLIGTINRIGLLDLSEFYNTGTENIRFFDQSNGFLGTECRHNATFKDSKGNHWICTSNNVVMFNPDKIQTDTIPPPLYFTDIKTLDKNLEWQVLPDELHNERIETKKRNLQVGFHALNFNAPENVRYSYFLEGHNQQWTNPSKIRNATFTGLKPGDYNLKVKASNGDGYWMKEPVELSMTIIPFFWETLIFKLILFAIIIAGFVLSARTYSRRKIKKIKADEQRKKDLLKHQFLSINNLINPHFTFNVINSISSSILEDNKTEANDYLLEFSYLLKRTLEYSDEISWPLKMEINFLKDYLSLQKYRFEDLFEYRIEIDDKVNSVIQIPKMVVQGYVENAIKHGLRPKGGNGLLLIKTTKEAQIIKIEIKDNGIGRPVSLKGKQTQGTGKGMQINSEMVKLYNELSGNNIHIEIVDLYDNYGNSIGTKVLIFIPTSS